MLQIFAQYMRYISYLSYISHISPAGYNWYNHEIFVSCRTRSQFHKLTHVRIQTDALSYPKFIPEHDSQEPQHGMHARRPFFNPHMSVK
jgi:hypothetical protein